MKVLKFGGTSVGTVESLRNVKRIVDSLEEPGIVVVSALGGLTDGLIGTARMAAAGDECYKGNMRRMAERHFEIINTLVPQKNRSEVRQTVAEFLSQLENIYMGLSLIGDLPNKVLNRIVSFGERMSSIMVANILKRAEHANPLDFIKTKKEYGKDILAAEHTEALIRSRFPLPLSRTVVTGGFISRDVYTSEITNLGRGGSDFTAALIAAALDAEALEIWTDVDGFMTADPRIVADAKVIESLSYPESTSLCEHGAKVIYPPTLYPVCSKKIPLRVLNTHNPSAPGTLICSHVNNDEKHVCGIACMKDVSSICFKGREAAKLVDHEKVKEVLHRHGVDVLFFECTPDGRKCRVVVPGKDAHLAWKVLKDEFRQLKEDRKISDIELVNDLAMVTAVGHSFDDLNGLRTRLVDNLNRNGVTVYAVDNSRQGNVDHTALVVHKAHKNRCQQLLHEECFGC